MSFCSFSKEFNENTYTSVENQFIVKYLPGADGFAVKVYLYGLYLCQNADSDFTLFSMAEVLKAPKEKIEEAFEFWEDYDLVQILSRDPFAVTYLPVRSAVGRPRKVRYEQYTDFNKELQRKMQSVGKFVSYNESIKYMHFLDENNIQPQAFLLIAEYCINKQGESVSPSYIFNKAKKFIRNGWVTYEQVERELSNYNAHENDLAAVFSALSLYTKPDESDYALYEKWTDKLGFSRAAVIEAAKHLRRGNMSGLDLLLCELSERGKLSQRKSGAIWPNGRRLRRSLSKSAGNWASRSAIPPPISTNTPKNGTITAMTKPRFQKSRCSACARNATNFRPWTNSFSNCSPKASSRQTGSANISKCGMTNSGYSRAFRAIAEISGKRRPISLSSAPGGPGIFPTA